MLSSEQERSKKLPTKNCKNPKTAKTTGDSNSRKGCAKDNSVSCRDGWFGRALWRTLTRPRSQLCGSSHQAAWQGLSDMSSYASVHSGCSTILRLGALHRNIFCILTVVWKVLQSRCTFTVVKHCLSDWQHAGRE